MREASPRIRGLVGMVALAAAILLAAGCGSSSDDEVAVQTGSLSKAAFIKKADAICQTVRTEFTNDYIKFVKSRKAKKYDSQSTEDFLGELVELVIEPHFENEIQQIAELGAPQSYSTEVKLYLDTVEGELELAQEDPIKVTGATTPFGKAKAAAEKVGLNGCAESLT